MKASLNELLQEYERLLDSQVFNPDELDYSILDYHIPLLECIDVVDNGCISIFEPVGSRRHPTSAPGSPAPGEAIRPAR